MKFSTTLAMGLAPVALARQVRNVYPPSRRDGHLVGGVEQHEPVAQPEHKVVEAPQEHKVVEPPKQEHEVVQAPPKHEPVQVADPVQWKKDDQKLIDAGYGVGHKEEIIIIWAEKPEEERVNFHEQQTVTETVTKKVAEHQATPPPKVHPPEAAATHTVTVGGPDGLIFQPEELHDVPMGDMVIFEFLEMNHTVTQSTFDVPCEAMEGGMDSGHQPNPENTQPAPQVAMQVTTSDPLWFYCKTGDHCTQGMVFSINPTEENTHAIFKETAIKGGEGADTPIVGGEPSPPAGGEEGGEAAEPSPTPAAPTPEPPVGGGEATKPGAGVVGEDGACHCMVACDMGAGWPAAEQQGLGASGGWSGALDMSQGGVGLRRR